jgi:hypothetical protein
VIEHEPFTVYVHAKSEFKNFPIQEFAVRAFLLAFQHQGDRFPEKNKRGIPSWFTPEGAKSALAKDRAAKYANEFARVVDLATARIAGR